MQIAPLMESVLMTYTGDHKAENFTPAESLPTWTVRAERTDFESRLLNSPNSAGRKQASAKYSAINQGCPLWERMGSS